MVLFLVVTDGLRVLCTESPGGALELPNSKSHWPVVRPVPKTKWPSSLLQHVCYGILPQVLGPHQRPPRPFGLPANCYVAMWTIEPAGLDHIVQACRRQRNWTHSYAAGHMPWSIRAVPGAHPALDLMAAHCTRALLPASAASKAPERAEESDGTDGLEAAPDGSASGVPHDLPVSDSRAPPL